ncbi:MAG: hypothetical protein ICV75_08960, partial [Nitrospiraceae bacterium]|nr:hypothetical protein [Nitrospiraceae bacterium]
MMKARRVHVLSCRITMVLCLLLQMAGCGLLEQRSPGQGNPQRPAPAARPLEPQQAERLKQVMIPLLSKMDKPLTPHQVSISFMDDQQINAANAGGGKFFVTRGLLE